MHDKITRRRRYVLTPSEAQDQAHSKLRFEALQLFAHRTLGLEDLVCHRANTA